MCYFEYRFRKISKAVGKVSLVFGILLVGMGTLLGQETIIHCSDSTFCLPSVFGVPRAKGVIIKQERVMNYGVRSYSKQEGLDNGEGDVRLNRRWDLRLRVPILRKPGIKVALGFRYFHEEYRFEDLPDYPLYRGLEDKALKSMGVQLFLAKPFKGNKYFLFRLSTNLNGDYHIDDLPTAEFLKFSIAPLYGWKANPYTAFAFGIAYSNDFGRQGLFPVFSYIHTFNSHWGLEALLPSKTRLRYSPSEKTNLYVISELNGNSYTIRLDEPALSGTKTLNLRKSEIRFLLSFEREIHDWLWFGVESGFRTNINFSLRDGPERGANEVIDNRFNNALVFNLSLFVVPPRRFLD